MTIFSLTVSSMVLTDVSRRSFYAHVTLLGRTAWVQWWPRTVWTIDLRKLPTLTAGVR